MPEGVAAVLLAAGVAFIVAGAIAISWPAGFIAIGILLTLTVADLRR